MNVANTVRIAGLGLAVLLTARAIFYTDDGELIFSKVQPPGVGFMEDPCPDAKIENNQSSYVRQYDWAWKCRFTQENRAYNKDKPASIVFIGDSITERWPTASPELFTSGMVGRGIGWQTSPQLALRFYQDVVALHPKAVHIMVGLNDIAGHAGPTTEQAYQDNIRMMVDVAQANNIRVVLGSITPVDHREWNPEIGSGARIVSLNRWLRSFANARGLTFADYYSALAGSDGILSKPLAADAVHVNQQGYAIMRPIAEAAFKEALAKP